MGCLRRDPVSDVPDMASSRLLPMGGLDANLVKPAARALSAACGLRSVNRELAVGVVGGDRVQSKRHFRLGLPIEYVHVLLDSQVQRQGLFLLRV